MTSTIEKTFINKKCIYAEYGIDWQRTDLVHIYSHTGSFTIKKLVKKFNLDSNDLTLIYVRYKEGNEYKVGLIKFTGYGTLPLTSFLKEPERRLDFEEFDFFKLTEDFRITGYSCQKKFFNEVRKQEDVQVCVVTAKKEAVTLGGRNRIWDYQHEPYSFLARVDVAEQRFIYKPDEKKLCMNGCKATVIYDYLVKHEVIDKSGYSLSAKRNQLKEKAKKEALNRLEEVRLTYFEKDNALLKSKIDNEQKELVEKLRNATTSKELIGIQLDISKLTDVVKGFELHMLKLLHPDEVIRRREQEYHFNHDNYSSIQEVEEEIKRLNKILDTSTHDYIWNK